MSKSCDIFIEDCLALDIAVRHCVGLKISFSAVKRSLNFALGEKKFTLPEIHNTTIEVPIPESGRFINDLKISRSVETNLYNEIGGANDFDLFRATTFAAWLVGESGREYFEELSETHQPYSDKNS